MGTGLLPLVVMVAVVALSSDGAAQSPSPDLDCDAADTVVKEEHSVVFAPMTSAAWNKLDTDIFVKPESGFEGILIDVMEGDDNGTHHISWLAAEDCVSPNGTWWLIRRMLRKPKEGIIVAIDVGTCLKVCTFNITEPDLMRVIVEAHGPSRWRRKPPPGNCSVVPILPIQAQTRFSCEDPPSSITTNRTTSHTTSSPPPPSFWTQDKITIIVLSGAVVVLVVLLVVLWKRKSVTSPNVMRLQSLDAAPRCTIQAHAPDQDKEPIYYELMPDGSERPEVAQRLAQDSEEPVYEDVVWPSSPIYGNLPAARGGYAYTHGHMQAPGVRESQLYDTVL